MGKLVRAFGYGSLMSQASLRATVPSAHAIEAVFIKGYTRSFNFWDSIGYTETNLDVQGEPMCALNISPSENPSERVTGVTFLMEAEELNRLQDREGGYDQIELDVYRYGKPEATSMSAIAFASTRVAGKYWFEGKAQRRYLDDFLGAAAQYGPDFYRDTVESTLIDGQNLLDIPVLRPIIETFGT